MIDINEISDFINKKQIVQEDLILRKNNLKNKINKQQIFLDEIMQAAEAIKNIAKLTQEQVKFKISEAGTLMLSSVFDDSPEIDVEFEVKRNQTECLINFKSNNELYSPMEEDGFGKADVAGFGLRIAIWSLPAQRTRKVFILDEVFKHLKGVEANVAAIQAVKKISEDLNLQIIMISDERVNFEEIEKGADKVFKVTMVNEESLLEVLK